MKKLVKVLSFIMLFAVALTLVACAPKDAAAAREKMEKKDYTVIADGGLSGLLSKDIETTLVCSKTEEKKDEKVTYTVTATLYKTKAAAKDAVKSLEETAKKSGYDSGVKQVGKWCYYGDKKAMKDFN